MYIYILILILIITIIYETIFFKKLSSAWKNKEIAFSKLNVILKSRWDLVPEIISDARKLELKNINIIEELILLKNKKFENMTDMQKIKIDDKINIKIMSLSDNEKLRSKISTFIGDEKTLKELKLEYKKYLNNYQELYDRHKNNIILKIVKR